MDVLGALKDQMTGMEARLESRIEQRISRLEAKLNSSDQSSAMKIESVEDDHHEYNNGQTGADAQEADEEHPSSPGNSHDADEQKVSEAHELLRLMGHDEVEMHPGEPVHPGQPSLPANHTTLAAFLLKWPSIKLLLSDTLEKEGVQHINDFPIGQEQQRGPLRVWGRGEGYLVGNKQETSANQIMTDVTGDSPNANTDAPSPYSDSAISTDRDAWGPVGLPGTQNVEIYKAGVLHADGNANFDRATVKQYVKSFEENVLNMHPILIPKQLHAMVTVFLDSLPQSNPKAPSKGSAKFVAGIAHSGSDAGLKRKRSPALEEQSPGVPFQKPGVPNRSIDSALVLAVLALGKICLWKDKIPELVQDQEPAAYTNSPSVRNGVLSSPAQGSPPGLLSTQASSLPSPKEPDRSLSSRRPSLQGANPPLRGQNMKRNLDVIPGLEYFGMAADILGSHLGSFTLRNVYVALFLGLYHGQLGRVLESWSYIALAGRQLQVVLRP